MVTTLIGISSIAGLASLRHVGGPLRLLQALFSTIGLAEAIILLGVEADVTTIIRLFAFAVLRGGKATLLLL